jgi:hypothetical protein
MMERNKSSRECTAIVSTGNRYVKVKELYCYADQIFESVHSWRVGLVDATSLDVPFFLIA